MATSTDSPGTSPDKYDDYLQRRIAQTIRQVTLVELLSFFLTLAIALLGALFVLCLIDAWVFELSVPLRWTALILLGVGSLGLAVYKAFPFLVHRINPIYAARKLEEGRPELKNSVINYLTTRYAPGQARDRSIRQKLSETAAGHVSHIPLDVAVDRTPMIIAGYVLAGVVTLFGLYKILSPKDPFQTISRVFLPSAALMAPSRVNISDVSPGDTEKYFGESVQISARIEGLKAQEYARLLITSDSGTKKDQALTMTKDPESSVYRLVVGEDQGLQESFTYRIQAGDASTHAYRVDVRTCPTIFIEKIEYQFPAYTQIAPLVEDLPDRISGIEGGRAIITGRANLPVETAYLKLFRTTENRRASDESSAADVEQSTDDDEATAESDASDDNSNRPRVAKSIKCEVDADQVVRCEFPLELNAARERSRFSHFQLVFTAQDGSKSENETLFPIEVIPDLNPEIEVIAPAEKVTEVPEDQLVKIEVSAVDPDYGLTSIVLVGEHKGSRLFEKRIFQSADALGTKGIQVGSFGFRPSQFGLEAGDEVIWFARAEDNRAVGPEQVLAPNRVRTENRKIVVLPALENKPTESEPDPAGKQPDDPSQQNPDQPKPQQPSDPQQQPGKQSDQNQQKGEQQGKQQGEQQGDQSGQPQDNQQQQPDASQSGQPGESQSAKGNSGEGQPGQPQPGQEPQPSGKQPPQKGEGQGQPQSKQQPSDASQSGKNQQSSDGQSREPSAQDPSAQPSGGNPDQPQKSPEQPGQSQSSKSTDPATQQPSDSTPNQPGQPDGNGQKSQQPTSPENAGDPAAGNRPDASSSSPANRPDSATTDSSGTGQQPANPDAADSANQPPQKPRNSREAFERLKEYFDQQENKDLSDSPGAAPDKSQPNPADADRPDPSSSPSGAGRQDEQKQPDRQPEAGNGADPSDGSERPDPQKPETPPGDSSAAKPGSEKEQTPGKGSSAEQSQEKQPGQPEPGSGKSADSGDPSSPDRQSPSGSDQQQDSQGKSEPDAPEKQATGQSDRKNQKGQDPESGRSDQNQSDQNQSDPGQSESSGQQPPAAKQAQKGQSGKSGKSDPSSDPPSENQPENQSEQQQRPDNAEPSSDSQQQSGGNTGNANQASSSAGQESDRPPSNSQANPNLPEAQAQEANLEYTKKATEMVLEKLEDQKQQPDPELLDRLNWTEDELREFTKKWQAIRERAQSGKPEDRQRFEDALRSLGLKDPQNRLRGAELKDDDKTGYQQKSGTRDVPSDFARKFRAIQKSQQKLDRKD